MLSRSVQVLALRCVGMDLFGYSVTHLACVFGFGVDLDSIRAGFVVFHLILDYTFDLCTSTMPELKKEEKTSLLI